MNRLTLVRLVLASLVLGAAGAWLPAVHGQAFRQPDQPIINQQVPVQTQVASLQSPYVPGFNPAVNPYPPYYGGFYPGRAGGYLYGVAAVTDANAQYQVT